MSDVKSLMRKHWSEKAKITDTLSRRKLVFAKGKRVADTDLLAGELLAETFHVGCYTVRSAMRVYRVGDSGAYIPDEEVPANAEETAMVRERTMLDECPAFTSMPFDLCWEYRMTHEISARLIAHSEEPFIYVCRATEAINHSWIEQITAICTAKESGEVSDKCASLLVCNHWVGSSFGCDTWYKLDPDGKVMTLTLHDFDSDPDRKRFVYGGEADDA